MSPEGWFWPGNARKAHYFRRGRSLCGRYGLLGGQVVDSGQVAHSPDDCAECTKRKRREAPAAGGAR